ncbi:MAG: hypothetical protein CL677_01260 [Bdellovibrionaceae bacterium]|nr:hypothetical protein [Pseudobdellovibrionaceae bacterium]|tara:strand:- start:188 stop:835 length:648 start_codon:yes stop_codon:yes gene_type:complete
MENDGLKKLKCKSDLHITRKIWHFLGIITIAIFFHNLTRPAALAVTLSLSVFLVLLDTVRLRSVAVNRVCVNLMGPVMREREKYTYSGTTALFVGVFFMVYLFPPKIVTLSLLFLAAADPLASYYGIKYGRDTLVNGKSLQGSMAAFFTCFFISLIFYLAEGLMTDRILIVSLLTGLCGAFAEMVSIGKLDDNLTFPLINSVLVWGLFSIFGAAG